MTRSFRNWTLFFTGFFLMVSRATAQDSDIRLNSIGFLPGGPKRASLLEAGQAKEWHLVRSWDANRVLSGVLGKPLLDPDYKTEIWTADFSAWQEEGDYYLEVPGLGRSAKFKISPSVYQDSLALNLKGFYGWRCGTEVKLEHGGKTFKHAACHLEDGYVDTLGNLGHSLKDGKGGWHDAGDYNKYVTNAGISVGCLLFAWEHFEDALRALPLKHLKARQGELPGFLQEVKWELDWLMKMQYGPKDGRVSEKLSAIAFGPFKAPERDVDTRYFCPFSTAATAAFTAMLAKASRAYQPFDPAYAAKCLDSAKLSWKFLEENPKDIQSDQSAFRTGSYASSDGPLRLWAAVELWETTGEEAYLKDFEGRLKKMGPDCDVDWDWGNQKNLALYAYALSGRPGRDAKLLGKLKDSIKGAADELAAQASLSGYGRALRRYYWGSNGSVARTALTLNAAYRLFKTEAYLEAAQDQLSHLYGRNFYNRSQVTGEGLRPPLHPHHRPSAAFPSRPPWPGLLVGGGESATGWLDVVESASSNEVAINWNAALTYNLAMFCPPLQDASKP